MSRVKCVECGRESKFWLCGNACALAYAKKRGRRDCAICSYNEQTGRIGRHDTSRLCEECHARAENVDWVDRQEQQFGLFLDGEMNDGIERLREQQDRPLVVVTAVVSEIARLAANGERVGSEYRDPNGIQRGARYRWRAYTIRRLAKKVGCEPHVVRQVLAAIEN